MKARATVLSTNCMELARFDCYPDRLAFLETSVRGILSLQNAVPFGNFGSTADFTILVFP